MPTSRYRLRHTRRVRQTDETEQNEVTEDARNLQATENDEHEDERVTDNGTVRDQWRGSQLQNDRRHMDFTENLPSPDSTNHDMIRSQHTGLSSPYLDGVTETGRGSRNYERDSNTSTTSRTESDVRLSSRLNTVVHRYAFDQSFDEQELPSDVKYMKFQRDATPDTEQPGNKKRTFRGHKRRSSSCELNRTFTSSNENTLDRKGNFCDFKDSAQTDPVNNIDRQNTEYYYRQESCSNIDQVVEVTCRSASNSSTFYNIVSYSNNIYKTRESVKVPAQDERDKTYGKESFVTKRDVATNTDDSFGESEFDFPGTESGKVSRNSVVSDKICRTSAQSGKTTATSNEFEIPDWRNSKASTPLGNISGTTVLSDSKTPHYNVLTSIDAEIIDINETKFNTVRHHKEAVENIESNTKHCCTQTDKEISRPTRDLHLESHENTIQPKVDTWQKDWIPSYEYKRNENFQIFSKFMHFDQIHAKVQSWQSDWAPAGLKKREQVNLNTNKEFLRSLKHVGSRIDTGTRNTVGNQWSRHMTQKSKIKSAPVNKKKPPCPQGPRRTRD